MVGAIILQIVLIFLNAVFASAEIAVLSVGETKLEKLKEDGNRGAKRLLKLIKNPSKFLSTIQVAITLAGLLGSAYAAENFADPLVGWLISLGVKSSYRAVLEKASVFVITLLLSFFSIVFGELVPKRLAMKRAEKMALGMSGVLSFVSVVFAPFVWILTKTTNLVLRIFGIDPNEESEAVTEEEIRLMLDSGSEKGTIDETENEMIQNIFKFDDTSVSEICTHRRDVAFLHKGDDISDWKETLSKSRHGYYPICGDGVDDIIGVLSVRKFFRAECKNVEEALRLAEKPYFVPETTKADVLFEYMQKERNYFAVVVDEYGGTSGVITIHDLLEFLVGDLGDKDEQIVPEIERLGETDWAILGAASLEDVAKELEVDLQSDEWDTFGGYIIGLIDTIPDDGTTFELETDDVIIRVERVEDHRIERTRVTKKARFNEEDED